jgi:hypothetical protein
LRVAVRFARRSGRDAADDDVAAMVAQHPEPSSLSVVTSDGALADPCARAARSSAPEPSCVSSTTPVAELGAG